MQGPLIPHRTLSIFAPVLMLAQVALASAFLFRQWGAVMIVPTLFAAPGVALCVAMPFVSSMSMWLMRLLIQSYGAWLMLATPLLYYISLVRHLGTDQLLGEKALQVAFQLSMFVVAAIFMSVNRSATCANEDRDRQLYRGEPDTYYGHLVFDGLQTLAMDLADASAFFTISSLRQSVPGAVHAGATCVWSFPSFFLHGSLPFPSHSSKDNAASFGFSPLAGGCP